MLVAQKNKSRLSKSKVCSMSGGLPKYIYNTDGDSQRGLFYNAGGKNLENHTKVCKVLKNSL